MGALVCGLAFETLIWLVISPFLGVFLPALAGQVFIVLAWMVMTICYWAIRPPKSRLNALFSTIICLIIILFLGSFSALLRDINHHLIPNIASLRTRYAKSFISLNLLMILIQVLMAVPSAFVLNYLLLRVKPSVPN